MFRDFDPRRHRRATGTCRTPTSAATTASSEVLAMVERTADALVAALREPGAAAPARGARD